MSEERGAMSESTWQVVWMQRLTGGEEVLASGLTHYEAVTKMQEDSRDDLGPGAVIFVRREEPREEETRMNEPNDTNAFRHWAILELLGHVRLAGIVTEEERFGAKLGRIDIPAPGGGMTTQYFTAGGIYRLTPTTEAIARAVAEDSQPEPVSAWELQRALPAPAEQEGVDDEDDDDGYPI